ncbi:MAG: hypothetical protein AAF350_06180, partial [Pseudomonadota bacterium]
VLPDGLPAIAFAVVFAGLSFDLYRGTNSPRLAAALSFGATAILGLCAMLALLMDTSIAMVLLCIAIAGAVIAWGIVAKRPTATTLGVLTLVGALLAGIEPIVSLFVSGGWITLAIVGGTAIVGASCVDRFGPALMNKRKAS